MAGGSARVPTALADEIHRGAPPGGGRGSKSVDSRSDSRGNLDVALRLRPFGRTDTDVLTGRVDPEARAKSPSAGGDGPLRPRARGGAVQAVGRGFGLCRILEEGGGSPAAWRASRAPALRAGRPRRGDRGGHRRPASRADVRARAPSRRALRRDRSPDAAADSRPGPQAGEP